MDYYDKNSWEKYWAKKNRTSNYFYDFFAKVYRKFIIKRVLNFYIRKNFITGAIVLHAGCGSGQVDTEIAYYINIYALDFSKVALTLYKTNNHHYRQIVEGNILNIPFKNNFFDGIYNLGVLEHLSKKDIKTALQEFHRVLKPGGKIIIFWPPKYGLSVMFLNSIHYILNIIFKNNIRLHPDETSLLNSRQEAKKIFKQANFKIIDISFNLKDLFTFIIIVAQKPKVLNKINIDYE